MKLVATKKERLDKFLVSELQQHSRSKISKHIEAGKVMVNGDTVYKAGHELKPGMVIELVEIQDSKAHDLTPVEMEIDIVYEDDDLIMINKPRGLVVHPAQTTQEPTLVHGLLAYTKNLSREGGDFRPGIVHRLDKETTGLMVVAKNDQSHQVLSQQIQKRKMERRYVAFIHGLPKDERFIIDAPIGKHPRIPNVMAIVENGKEAVTHIKLLKRFDEGCLVACKLETGRTHQIRVHLSYLGHPVKGDEIYSKNDWSTGPMHLHSCSLRCYQPRTGEMIEGYAVPPGDFMFGDEVNKEDVVSWM